MTQIVAKGLGRRLGTNRAGLRLDEADERKDRNQSISWKKRDSKTWWKMVGDSRVDWKWKMKDTTAVSKQYLNLTKKQGKRSQ